MNNHILIAQAHVVILNSVHLCRIKATEKESKEREATFSTIKELQLFWGPIIICCHACATTFCPHKFFSNVLFIIRKGDSPYSSCTESHIEFCVNNLSLEPYCKTEKKFFHARESLSCVLHLSPFVFSGKTILNSVILSWIQWVFPENCLFFCYCFLKRI